LKVQLAELSQGYRGKTVLNSIDLELDVGITAVLGPNGAGKNTLLRTIATIAPPQSGRLAMDDLIIHDEGSARKIRPRIGYLPQRFGFDPSTRLKDFVCYAAWLRGMPPQQWGSAVQRALQQVELVEEGRARMRTLSGGMVQRAGIAWAIVGEPGLVLLDEPTVGLDPRQRLQFRKVVSGLRNSTVVLSTHLIDDVEAICDRVAVLRGGSLPFVGTTAELASLSRKELPGATALERAYMSLLPVQEQRL